jgi:4'-phosphopantetheinyl transferase
VTRWQRVGVDVERVRPLREMEAIAERMFRLREWRGLRRLPARRRQQGFFVCWTRMEAYGKALGDGIAGALARQAEGDAAESGRWSLEVFVPDPGYVAAVAVEGRMPRLVWRRWEEINPCLR